MYITGKHYRIVTEPDEADSNIETPIELEDELEDLYIKANKGKASVKGRLEKLIKRYPKAPFLRNYLVKWYDVNKQKDAAYRVNEELLRLFPDYIFAIRYKAAMLLAERRTEDVETLLAGRLDIESFYPGRKAFHLSEYRACIALAVDYLLATGRLEEAEERINLLEEAEIDDEITDTLRRQLQLSRIDKNMELYRQYQEMEIYAEERDQCTLLQKEIVMKASTPEFEFLYGGQWDIDEGQLRDNIENNKVALTNELHHILTIAIEGYEFNRNDYDEISSAVLHALLILPYVSNAQSFNIVLEFLRQPQACLDFWIDDWSSELLPSFFNSFSEDKLQRIFQFITEPLNNTNSKNALLEFLPLFALNNPDSQDKLIQCISTIFSHFTAHRDDETVFDTTVLAFAVGAAINLKATELTETIEQLYEKDWVSISVEGTIDEVKRRMYGNSNMPQQTLYTDVFAHLKHLKEKAPFYDSWHSRHDDDDSDFIDEEEELTPVNIFAGASKNAPCPCGSGKKYKRCHGL